MPPSHRGKDEGIGWKKKYVSPNGDNFKTERSLKIPSQPATSLHFTRRKLTE